MESKWGTRAGAAAFALGLSLAGPQALGLAGAETNDDAAVSSAPEQAVKASTETSKRDATRSERSVVTNAGRSAATSAPPRAAAATATPDQQRASASVSAPETKGSAKAAASARGRDLPRSAPVIVAVPTVADRDAVQAGQPAAAIPADAVADSPSGGAVAPAPALSAAPQASIAAAAPAPAPVAGFLDAAGGWLPGLPSGPVADYLAGAMLLGRRSSVAPAAAVNQAPAAATLVDPNQHVLLIGVDGTNLSAILSDPYNQAFFDLMDTGTTGPATMVGHTTISAPGWTGILTGVWSETAGVSNNVFTPWSYDDWPTVFNLLEVADPSIATTAIGNWSVIAQIAGAGSVPADTIVYYPEINDSWLDTDDAVGAKSIEAILNTSATGSAFQMTYFVGVDETGHDTGGSGTPEYAEALRNVNDNIADIMAAVDSWETANPGEEWTVIVVTDHGQFPMAPLGLGLLAHGFQSPAQTTVFAIADGPDFLGGAVNNTYSQVDVTPTILSLFGVAQKPYFQGSPLMDKAPSDYFPALPGQEALKNALSDAIDMYGYPDVLTNITLTLRTLVATVPYFIYTIFDGLSTAVPDFLALPVLAIGAVIYNLVNIPAQLIVRLTGVTGNSILPPQWWPYNPVPGTQPVPPTAALPTGAVAV